MVGIIILNYNSWDDTKECIKSIWEAEQKLDYRIYLVDNCSPIRPDAGWIEEMRQSGIVLIQNEQNTGYSSGNNVGIRKALADGCDALLISNSDVRYEKDSISKMYQYLEKNPETGIVGPKIVLKDGSTQKECMMKKTGMREKYFLRTRFYMLFPKLNKEYWGREHDYENETFVVYAVLGCCFMFSRNCALEVTPLDEESFLYEEELILGISMERAGWETVYYPESVIHHLHGNSTQRVKAFAYTCNVCSEIYYCSRYLEMKNWQILPLYWYRTLLYEMKALRYQDFRQYRKNYHERTKKSLREYRRM